MNKNSHNPEVCFKNLCKLIKDVKKQTKNKYVLSSDIFRGLAIKHGVSNENTVGVFIAAKLFAVDTNRKGFKGSKYVKWCGPANLTIEEIAKQFIIVRESRKGNRGKKAVAKPAVAKILSTYVETVTKPVVVASTTKSNEITRAEFRSKYYGGTRPRTVPESLTILSELFKHLNGVWRLNHEVFRIYAKSVKGIFEYMDIRDMFGRRKSAISIKLLVELGILKRVGKKYTWNAGIPTAEMVETIYFEDALKVHTVKYRLTVVASKPVEVTPVAETEIEGVIDSEPEVKSDNFRQVIEIADDIKPIDVAELIKPDEFKKLALDPKLNYLYEAFYKSEMGRRILDEQKAKNEYEKNQIIIRLIRGE